MGAAARVDGIRLSLWRALGVFRVVALVVALVLIVHWQPIYAHPGVALAVGAGMIVTTVVVTRLGRSGRAHGPWLVIGDLVVTGTLTLLTLAAQTPEQLRGGPDGMVTLTTIWAAGPTIEAGLVCGSLGGIAVGAVQYGITVLIADTWLGRTLYSGMLLVVVGAVVGLVSTYTARAERELRVAAAAQAALAERERMSRSIHDGVLQVLGLVHRAGRDADGQWARLAAAAAEQEAALRGLITSAPPTPPAGTALGDTADLAAELRELRSARVTVSTPGEAVALPLEAATEVRDAVRAALANVQVHAGVDARAWVLLETVDDEVWVTVRDDGVGMPDGRLEQAERDGRIGVARSVRGRITDLGGRCTIRSTPGGGTQVEMIVPMSR